MDLSLVQKARRGAVVVGALAALIVPACASDRGGTVASVPPGMGMARPAVASGDAPKTASAPLGYPWAAGASLPTAIAKAPGNEAH
jgi:hypothetical protein